MRQMISSTAFVACFILAFIISPRQNAACAQTLKCSQLLAQFPGCNCYGQMVNGVETVTPVLDCSARNLTSVPRPLNPYTDNIAEFRLNGNNITTLQANAFAGLKIEKLDLSDNDINNVSDDAFNGLQDHTHTLILQGDGVVSPPKGAFPRLPNLESLTLKKYGVPQLDHNTEHSFFLAFRFLSELTLDTWGLNFIEPDAFIGPDKLLRLSLLNQAFDELNGLPIDAFRSSHMQHLQKLVVSGSRLTTLTYGVFENMDNITEIDLSGNLIGLIERNSFLGAGDTLLRLDLSNNVITRDGLVGLQNMASLRELDLSMNPDLRDVPDLSQLGTTSDLTLSLDNCDIASVGENDLAGIAPRLYHLDLAGNRISLIHANAFTGMTGLHTLRLDNQRGSSSSALTIPASLAQAAPSLTALYISGQPLEPNSLWSVVSQLTNLHVLNLASAELSQVPDLALENLSELQELHLDYNQLTALKQESLVGPRRSLRSLYLSGNSLQTLPSCLLHQYELQQPPLEMSLDLNPLVCDCKLRWLLHAVRANNVSFNPGAEPTCVDGTQLLNKSDSSLTCPGGDEGSACANYYTNDGGDPTGTPGTPTQPAPRVETQDIDQTYITWTIQLTAGLRHFEVEVRNRSDGVVFSRKNLAIDVTSAQVPGLKPNSLYTFCVFAVYSDLRPSECRSARTLPSQDTTPGTDRRTDEGETEVGIIVGAVVGAVVLLALLIAIFYLVVIRRRQMKKSEIGGAGGTHAQPPRTFTKSELPTMAAGGTATAGGTRTFTRPKKPVAAGQNGGSGDEEQGGMRVVAISDGQTGNGNVGRAHRLLSNDGYKDMSGSSSVALGFTNKGLEVESDGQSTYENDHGPLPATPTSVGSSPSPPPSYGAYYNDGYQTDKYEEIIL